MMDRRARFERLYGAHADRVHAYALRRGSREAADDVVSDVFLVAWRRLDELPSEPLPWLYGVARRALANRRRGENRAAALQARLAGTLGRPEAGAPPRSVRDDRVQRALAGLPARDRELLLLIAWEGLRVNEAAEVLGVRSGTLATRLYRARARLAEALAEEDAASERPARQATHPNLEVGR
jgi:RNA polymerase sigma-70 factor (ECF subfamily)